MKLAILLTASLLAGCATSHGSWLDNVGKPLNPPAQMTDAEALQLSQQAAQLQARAEAIRGKLAHEPDRIQRVRQYRELRSIGDALLPLERQLRDAGRAPKTAIVRPAAA